MPVSNQMTSDKQIRGSQKLDNTGRGDKGSSLPSDEIKRRKKEAKAKNRLPGFTGGMAGQSQDREQQSGADLSRFSNKNKLSPDEQMRGSGELDKARRQDQESNLPSDEDKKRKREEYLKNTARMEGLPPHVTAAAKRGDDASKSQAKTGDAKSGPSRPAGRGAALAAGDAGVKGKGGKVSALGRMVSDFAKGQGLKSAAAGTGLAIPVFLFGLIAFDWTFFIVGLPALLALNALIYAEHFGLVKIHMPAWMKLIVMGLNLLIAIIVGILLTLFLIVMMFADCNFRNELRPIYGPMLGTDFLGAIVNVIDQAFGLFCEAQ